LTPQTRLIDLYCGYGLFAICLSAKVQTAIGMDVSADSIDAAIANARRNGVTNAKFLRGDITINTLPRVLRTPDDHKVVLLDPPRNGTGPGVIEYIAAAMPRQVLHIFCNINIMPAELNRWTENGFRITKAVPLDMFPGTSTIETMVLLERP
jgi:tRNA/tmRNA/rRNA uracil-C5-methylase (TrmA/RlmC/RlmD family)